MVEQNYLFNKAEAIGSDKKLLLRRLKEGIGVLNNKYRKLFKVYTYDFSNKCLISHDNMYILKWENTGTTSEGLVHLEKLAK